MPYSTVVAGTNITASWGNSNVRDQVVTPFTSTAARDSAITSPVSGMVAAITSGTKMLTHYNGSVWVCITPLAANVATSQTTTSTSYTDLATTGPAVTIVTGATALVEVGAHLSNNTASDGAQMGFAVSGATTVAATDNAAFGTLFPSVANIYLRGSREFYVTGLTPGSNVFTAKYRADVGGTATFADRMLSVIGLP